MMKKDIEILIVEDSLTQAMKLKGLLDSQGYNSRIAVNGQEALHEVRKKKASLIIADILMPVMDGYEMCRKINSDKDLKNIPIILLTTLSKPEDIINGLSVKADCYITKPYEDNFLLSKIKDLLATSMEVKKQRGTKGLEVTLSGKHYTVTSNRLQILTLLLATYENAVAQNKQLLEVQRELQKARDELEFKVHERTAELVAANENLRKEIEERKRAEEELKKIMTELERSNNELQRFAYVASHDLQEPLRMISSFTQLLAKRYRGNLDSDADDFMHYIVEGATRMQALINGLLSYSRINTRGKDFTLTDCETVLENTLANLHSMIEEIGAEITHDPLPTVIADDSQMVQLFQNLIGNAIKFRSTEPSQIHISAQEISDFGIRNAESELKNNNRKLKIQNGYVFSVSDNGIGIAPEFHERIFTIFQRLHGKDEYNGTGIGLAICKRIIDRLGGEIWVESEMSKGSTFYFTIPNSINEEDGIRDGE